MWTVQEPIRAAVPYIIQSTVQEQERPLSSVPSSGVCRAAAAANMNKIFVFLVKPAAARWPTWNSAGILWWFPPCSDHIPLRVVERWIGRVWDQERRFDSVSVLQLWTWQDFNLFEIKHHPKRAATVKPRRRPCCCCCISVRVKEEKTKKWKIESQPTLKMKFNLVQNRKTRLDLKHAARFKWGRISFWWKILFL